MILLTFSARGGLDQERKFFGWAGLPPHQLKRFWLWVLLWLFCLVFFFSWRGILILAEGIRVAGPGWL